jgi:diguanylate cyclase (GGDEF)-like protein/PAS domain S-box-containing protein
MSLSQIDAGREDTGRIVMELDRELRHVRASAAALAMVGLPAEALVGRTSGEAGLPPEVVGPLERELRRVVATGAERQLELEMPTVEGVRWLHLRLIPADDPGDAGLVTLVASDITDRKHAELRLSGGNAAFRTLVENSPDPIARLDADLRITFVNAALERVTGHPAGEFLGRAVGATPLPREVAGRWERSVRGVLESGQPLALDFRLDTPDGARWFSARMLPEEEPGGGGEVGHVILVCTDVTDRVNREAQQSALRRVATTVAREADLAEVCRVVAQETAMLLNASGSAVYRFASEGEAACIASYPSTAARDSVIAQVMSVTGATATGQVARTGYPSRVDDYGAVERDDSVEEVLSSGLLSGIAAPLWLGARLWGALTAGSRRAGAFNAGDERRLAAFAELAAIAVANAEARAELAHLADTDALTGLANRRAFTARLDGEVERARRYGHKLTLAILDIDGFKGINDTHGHQAGDRVLMETGRRLAATSRAGELVARMGGEEFAWILPGVDAAGSLPAVERARAEIASMAVDGVEGVTCSAGLCDLETATDPDELMRLADRALYRAKAAGRDRVASATA